jgi:hypothetical protein
MTDQHLTTQKPPKLIDVANCYFYATFVTEVVKELQEKVFLVKTGFDTMSKSDQFTFCVLKELGYFEVKDPITPIEDDNQ